MELPNFLSSVKQFEPLSKEEIQTLVSAATVQEYTDGQEIKKRGELSRSLWVVYDGKANVALTEANGEKKVIATLTRGEIFGEMSLMSGEPSEADIVAYGGCKVIRLDRELCSDVIMKNPKTLTIIAQTITRRLIQRERENLEKPDITTALQHNTDPYDLEFSSAIEPIKVLVINSRIASLKYALFDTKYSIPLMDGLIDKIGTPNCSHTVYTAGSKHELTTDAGTTAEAIKSMVTALLDYKYGMIKHIDEIKAVGHRVVHGGANFFNSVVIDDKVKEVIRQCSQLAPLHNPYNLAGIEEMMKLLHQARHVAVFDTAFHRNMPEHAYKYALSKSLNEDETIRRYGFHGINHRYVTLKAATYLKRSVKDLKIISCHLGHGASLCAIDHGRSIDTSMGMTPLEGLMMGTRCGDVDPGVIIYLMKLGFTADELSNILNVESGLKGVSGVSNCMKDVLDAAEEGNKRAKDAIGMYCYRIKKYIGAYIAALGGLDVLIFTGGIGENSTEVRARVCQGLQPFGISLYEEANRQDRSFLKQVEEITAPGSNIRVLVIKSNENMMIARETLHAMGRLRSTNVEEYRRRPIPINVSAHHVHVNQAAFEVLFGPGRTLTPRTPLSQPGQYASEETVNLIGPKGRVEKVRILGPFRKECQVEIARTEEFKLGIDAPVRDSGDIEGTPGIILEGEVGQLKIDKGVICARRHVHMSPEDALGYGLRDRDVILVKVQSKRELIFGDVLVRVNPDFRLDMHIDTDEGNAVEHVTGIVGYIEGIQSRAYM
ncbi:acetate/propionate family kinase [Candidatus Magnetobacterium casense]|uniref:Acetate kinase n=1 Tax=Candidatus Magnetobacterium casense TaxID=1455061 RepID=A0ABS6RZ88_9BACT|nr:acetate/propionate family kinase [Candidatus Magnetobacterium casensis]MBV6341334.1 acetate/propionate family kinase [Candidatus Magnetobacterium casensis]